ncbi:MAG: prolipoprotein diacylglyceryl transferase [Armatimonadetes bacterium]|nr:prolipoprotein diacylglyceryl transferase [Armatimonadota bacterium]
MHPILFNINGFELRSFGVMLMIGFLVGIAMASRRSERFGLKSSVVQDSAIWLIVAGIIGARVLFIVQEWPKFAGRPDQIFKIQMDGLTSFGGLLGGLLAILIVSKLKNFKPSQLFDTVGIPMLVAHAIGRVGCLLNGCCYGHACETSPPGVHVEGLPGYFLPAQLVDFALVLIGAFIVSRIELGGKLKRGQSFSLVLVVYGVARFIYEFFRAGTSSTTMGSTGMTEAHVAAAVMAMFGFGLYLYQAKRSQLVASETVS